MSTLIFLAFKCLLPFLFCQMRANLFFLPLSKTSPTVPCYKAPLLNLGLCPLGRQFYIEKMGLLCMQSNPQAPFPCHRGGVAYQLRNTPPGLIFGGFNSFSGSHRKTLYSPHLFKPSERSRSNATCLLQRLQTGNISSFKMFKL